MAGLRPVAGGRALLFERLVDLEPGRPEVRPFILHDRTGLKASVAIELERLLSTRLSLPPADLERRERTTLDYGIPDGAVIAPADSESRKVLAAQIEAAILAFEPRLIDPHVTLRQTSDRNDTLVADIAAQLEISGLLEPVSFAIPLGTGNDER